MSHVIYIIGYPGSGKTTALRTVLADLPDEPVTHKAPVPHVRRGPIWHLGVETDGPFSGTDKLSMSIQPKAVTWLSEGLEGCDVLIAEGDRLANVSFFAQVRLTGHHLTVVNFDLPPTLARDRALHRAGTNGLTAQPDSWWRGRVTKTDRLTSSRPTLTIDATAPPEAVAHQLAQIIPHRQPAH